MKWYILFFFFSLYVTVMAQIPEPLKVGDPVDNVSLTNMMNFDKDVLTLASQKGKLVILDFWSTGCRSCLESWPKLLKLQKEFEKDVQIILVNPWEDKAAVEKAFARRKKVANITMTLPASCGKDSTILKQFPVSGVPHVVWVDREGKIMSITYNGSVNAANVKAILNNEMVRMPQKVDNNDFIKPDFSKALFVNGNGGQAKKVFMQSILTDYPPNLWSAQSILNDSVNGYGATCAGCSIDVLYSLAYSNRVSYNGWILLLQQNRMELDVSDATKLQTSLNGEVQYQNLYAYHLVTPPTTVEKIQERMRQDLDNYFDLDARWEKRKKLCLVWKLVNNDSSKIAFKGGGVEHCSVEETKFYLNGKTIKFAIEAMEEGSKYHYSPYPIIDETGFKGKVGGVVINAKVEDHRELDKAFRKFGMSFTLEERIIDVLVIREKNNGL